MTTTDTAAVTATDTAAGPTGLGAAPGYRPGRTFTIWTETRRQASRRRTQLALGFLVLLPLIVLGAFQLNTGDDDGRRNRGQFATLVDAATGSGPNFALFTLFVSAGFLLVVAVALFCGDTVASEASWGSLRYLLAVPVPRARLLAVKLIVALLYSLAGMVLLVGTALAAGTARYGWHPLTLPAGGQISAGDGVLRLLLVAGYMSVSLLIVGSLAFLLSVLTDAPLGAVGGAVLLNILSSILDQITALGSIRNVLPTHYSDAYLGALSSPITTDDMVKGTIAALCYATVFIGLAFFRFSRKDVVS